MVYLTNMLQIGCTFLLLLLRLLLLFPINCATFVLLQNESINESVIQCDPEMVLIADQSFDSTDWDVVCLPKVHLNDPCELDEQCNSKTPNSFCALLDDYLQNDLYQDIRPVCLCRDDFTPSMDNLHCIPVQYCTFDDFNSAMEQMDCQQENQFCREGVCRCIPDHGLNHTGQCVPVRSNFSLPDSILKRTQKPNNLSDRIVNKLASWLENILLISQKAKVSKCCVLFLLLEYLTGLALFLLGQIIWSFCLE